MRRFRMRFFGSRRSPILAGAVLLLALACARQGAPPGGPQDRLSPIVASSEPDTFATVEPFRSPVKIRFSERISERTAAGPLDQAVVVSPTGGDVRVSHTRDGLEVSVLGGFEAGLVYRVTVLPVVQDMFGNALEDPYELFFSTGPEFTPNVLAGSVRDRITGRPTPSVRVDAVTLGSTVIHTAVADTSGIFALRYLPPGDYQLRAYEDRNRNGEPDYSEPQNARVVLLRRDIETADTVITPEMPLLPRDSTAAQVTRIDVEDSLSLRFSFDDFIDPEVPLDSVLVTLIYADEDPPGVVRVLHAHEVAAFRQQQQDSIAEAQRDSLAAAAAAAPTTAPDSAAAGVEPPDSAGPAVARPDSANADSVAVGQAVGDSAAVGAAGDPVPVREPGAPLTPVEFPVLPGPGEPEPEPDPTETGPPLPERTVVAVLDTPLVPEVLYEAEITGVTNINGRGGGGGSAGFTRPAPPPPDTTAADSLAVPDSTGVPVDTTATDTTGAGALATPDSTGAAVDTTGVDPLTLPDSTGTPVDTIRADVPGAAGDSLQSGDSSAADDNLPARDSTLGDTVPRDTVPRDTVPRDTVPQATQGPVQTEAGVDNAALRGTSTRWSSFLASTVSRVGSAFDGSMHPSLRVSWFRHKRPLARLDRR